MHLLCDDQKEKRKNLNGKFKVLCTWTTPMAIPYCAEESQIQSANSTGLHRNSLE